MPQHDLSIYRDVSNRLFGNNLLLEDGHLDPLGGPLLLALPDCQPPVLNIIAETNSICVLAVVGVEVCNSGHFNIILSRGGEVVLKVTLFKTKCTSNKSIVFLQFESGHN